MSDPEILPPYFNKPPNPADLTLRYYQKRAMHFALPSARQPGYMIPGLVAEAGELAGHYAKMIRGDSVPMDTVKENIKKELGDVLWFVAGVADLYGFTLDEIAVANLTKLADRKARGVIQGSGDNR